MPRTELFVGEVHHPMTRPSPPPLPRLAPSYHPQQDNVNQMAEHAQKKKETNSKWNFKRNCNGHRKLSNFQKMMKKKQKTNWYQNRNRNRNRKFSNFQKMQNPQKKSHWNRIGIRNRQIPKKTNYGKFVKKNKQYTHPFKFLHISSELTVYKIKNEERFHFGNICLIININENPQIQFVGPGATKKGIQVNKNCVIICGGNRFRISMSKHNDKIIVWNHDLLKTNLLNFMNHANIIEFINVMNTTWRPGGGSSGNLSIFGIWIEK